MLIILSIISILFLIQFLYVRRHFEIESTPFMGVLYYSSMLFLSIIGSIWFLVFICNVTYWIYSLFAG